MQLPGFASKLLANGPRPLIIAATFVLALVLALLLLTVMPKARPLQAEILPAEAVSPARNYIEDLIMPGPLPGDLPFPLARARKSRYTEAEVQMLRPDLGSLPLGDFVERRKAELEAIYNAVD